MDDLISRQAVIDLIADYDLSMGQVVKGIHALPSVTPQEPKWIPVSEQLPITVDIKYFWVCTDKGHQCKAEWLVWHWNYHNIPIGEKIIAWRELPEPYREEKE